MRASWRLSSGDSGRVSVKVVGLSLSMVIWFAMSAKAQITGDVELLKLATEAHKDNRDRILTWQGTAHVEMLSTHGSSRMLKSRNSASFLLDTVQNAVRWSWTVDERQESLDGRLVTAEAYHGPTNGMKKGDLFYRFAPNIIKADGQREHTLVVFPGHKARTDKRVEDFDPMWYLTKSGRDVSELLLFYYGNSADPKIGGGTVRRQGDVVVLETSRSGIEIDYEFDLSKGGNLVRYSSRGPTIQGTIEWTYEKQAGIWVPKTYERRVETKREDDELHVSHRKVGFSKNTLNEPIDPSEFTLKKLGVKAGTEVSDHIVGVMYTHSGDSADPMLDVRPLLTEEATDTRGAPAKLDGEGIPSARAGTDRAVPEEVGQSPDDRRADHLAEGAGLPRHYLVGGCVVVTVGLALGVLVWRRSRRATIQ